MIINVIQYWWMLKNNNENSDDWHLQKEVPSNTSQLLFLPIE